MRQNRTGDEEQSCNLKILNGVLEEDGLLYFSVSVPEAEECLLKLYRGQELITKIQMTQKNQFGTIFFAVLDNRKFQADRYRYEACGKEFTDPCARRLIGREEFGTRLEDGLIPELWGGFVKQEFDWTGEKWPEYLASDLVIYKLHVRGFTMQENSGVKHKGTYLGVTEKIPYLKTLGINAVMLMPCVEFDEFLEEEKTKDGGYAGDLRFLATVRSEEKEEKPLSRLNYWGYSKQNYYFAPKAAYASKPEQAADEFRSMVKELHAAGIEVYLEMNLDKKLPQSYMLDILRYWVSFYHVDGFRIDPGVVSGDLAACDPVLGRTRLFSSGWSPELMERRKKGLGEWNDAFLAVSRQFLKGDENQTGAFAERFRYVGSARGAVNYLADHNGFTLQDMYSYDRKHNEANGEQNTDGTDVNFSWNCGVEGKTRKKKVNELRLRMKKNAVMALFFSQGTPMLLAGDEFGNSQDGNNNAYCQDNCIGWVDWKAYKNNQEFFRFVKTVIAVRKAHRIFHNPNQLRAMDYNSIGCPDLSYHGTKAWYPDFSGYSHTLGILLSGRYAVLGSGEPDSSFYLIFNMHWEPHRFDLPLITGSGEWKLSMSSDPMAENGLLPENLNNEKSEPEERKSEKLKAEKTNLEIEMTSEPVDRLKSYLAAPRSITVFESVTEPLQKKLRE